MNNRAAVLCPLLLKTLTEGQVPEQPETGEREKLPQKGNWGAVRKTVTSGPSYT